MPEGAWGFSHTKTHPFIFKDLVRGAAAPRIVTIPAIAHPISFHPSKGRHKPTYP